jgi:hypothetical protein
MNQTFCRCDFCADTSRHSHHMLTLCLGGKLFLAPLEKDKVKVWTGF